MYSTIFIRLSWSKRNIWELKISLYHMNYFMSWTGDNFFDLLYFNGGQNWMIGLVFENFVFGVFPTFEEAEHFKTLGFGIFSFLYISPTLTLPFSCNMGQIIHLRTKIKFLSWRPRLFSFQPQTTKSLGLSDKKANHSIGEVTIFYSILKVIEFCDMASLQP